MDRSERKALWIAILVGSLFIVTLAVAHQPAARKRKGELAILKPPPPTKHVDAQSVAELTDMYRAVPDEFKNIDFKNYAYGVYGPPTGRQFDLTLYAGQLRLPDDLGTFALKDVYYKDLTGDRQPEAIVRLSHVKCGGPCDGGASLLYIFTVREGKLNKIWDYETGSYANGCGLKSVVLGTRQVVVELFGRCPDLATEFSGPAKFVVEDLTFIRFEFDGRRFVTKTMEVIPEPARDVKNYEPEILIY
jgi:hypothetical protein